MRVRTILSGYGNQEKARSFRGKPLVVILSTIVGVKIFRFFFYKFFFKYIALIIIIPIGHAEN